MTAFLSPLAADIIGICGSVLFIIGFAYANLAKAMDQLLFNALNLGGAILLLISLSVHFNLAAVVLEVAWGAIALAGVIRALWMGRFKPLPSKGEVGVGAVDQHSARSDSPTRDGRHAAPVTPSLGTEGLESLSRPSPIASDSGR